MSWWPVLPWPLLSTALPDSLATALKLPCAWSPLPQVLQPLLSTLCAAAPPSSSAPSPLLLAAASAAAHVLSGAVESEAAGEGLQCPQHVHAAAAAVLGLGELVCRLLPLDSGSAEGAVTALGTAAAAVAAMLHEAGAGTDQSYPGLAKSAACLAARCCGLLQRGDACRALAEQAGRVLADLAVCQQQHSDGCSSCPLLQHALATVVLALMVGGAGGLRGQVG